jgi:hypothetical protein
MLGQVKGRAFPRPLPFFNDLLAGLSSAFIAETEIVRYAGVLDLLAFFGERYLLV